MRMYLWQTFEEKFDKYQEVRHFFPLKHMQVSLDRKKQTTHGKKLKIGPPLEGMFLQRSKHPFNVGASLSINGQSV